MGYRRIPPETRERVRLLASNGYSHREIAELTQVDRGTVTRMVKQSPPPGAATAVLDHQPIHTSAQDGHTAPAPAPVGDMSVMGCEVPIRNARDLLAVVDAKRKSLRLAEESGQVINVAVIRAAMMDVINSNFESYGPKFWRWCQERGMAYEVIRDYCVKEESGLIAVVNRCLGSVGMESMDQEGNHDV